MSKFLVDDVEFFDPSAVEPLNKGRIRLRGNLVAPVQAVVLCVIEQHLNAVRSYAKKLDKKGNNPYAAQIEYREHAISALTHLMTLLGQPVKRRLFWDAVQELWDGETAGASGGPDKAA